LHWGSFMRAIFSPVPLPCRRRRACEVNGPIPVVFIVFCKCSLVPTLSSQCPKFHCLGQTGSNETLLWAEGIGKRGLITCENSEKHHMICAVRKTSDGEPNEVGSSAIGPGLL
jgi:hypothetical protein